MFSIYHFGRKHIAKCLYGDDGASSLRKTDALLDGERKMTVDILYTLHKMEPLLDLEKTLKDMYTRYEIASFKKRRKRNYKYGPKEQEVVGVYDLGGDPKVESGAKE